MTEKQIGVRCLRAKKGVRLPVRRDRIRELVDAGFNESVLRELVDAFATADDRRRPPLAGMKTRELHGFVQRVLRVASEIKSLNEKLAEATRLPTSNLLGAGLPAELAFYAAWALASSKEPLEYRASERQRVELLLIAATRKFTGKCRWAAVAELLDVTPEALRQFVRDHRSLLRQIEDALDRSPCPKPPKGGPH